MLFASCLASSGVVTACSVVSACLLICLIAALLSTVFGFCSLFYTVHICNALWDSLSVLVHSGTAFLASQAHDWAAAPWDSLFGL